MVAERDDIRTCVQKRLGICAANALDLGGVFAVDNAKVCAQRLLLLVERCLQVRKADLADHVAHG